MGMGSYDESEQDNNTEIEISTVEEDEVERHEGEVEFNEGSFSELMENFKDSKE